MHNKIVSNLIETYGQQSAVHVCLHPPPKQFLWHRGASLIKISAFFLKKKAFFFPSGGLQDGPFSMNLGETSHFPEKTKTNPNSIYQRKKKRKNLQENL